MLAYGTRTTYISTIRPYVITAVYAAWVFENTSPAMASLSLQSVIVFPSTSVRLPSYLRPETIHGFENSLEVVRVPYRLRSSAVKPASAQLPLGYLDKHCIDDGAFPKIGAAAQKERECHGHGAVEEEKVVEWG